MISWTSSQGATPRTLVAFLCLCFAPSAFAKLGETVPQLVRRFGKSCTVESVQTGKKYKVRSANVSVDVVVANGFSVAETYLSDHPLTASGEPPNDIVQAVLRTNAPKARWVEIEAASFGADYALRSSDGEYIAVLKYSGAQPENSIWIMTVGLAKSVRALSSITSPSPSPLPRTATTMPTSTPFPTPSISASTAPSPLIDFSPSTLPDAEDLKARAETGDPNSEYQLGLCYYSGEGVAKDFSEAVKWFRKSAEQGFAQAQGYLGRCYLRGEGVTQDFAEAAKWSRKAADQGDSRGQNVLGVCYANGQGVAKDEVEAVKWYRKAAEQNYAMAQFNLGNCYANGKGVMKDEVEAVKWYRKAAEQNYALAQVALGVCYALGQGVAKDYAESYKWILLAAGQGEKHAKEIVTILENQMSREQIAEGQKLARNFKRREVPPEGSGSSTGIAETRPESSGTGFFITEDGYLITNEHVAGNGAQVRLVTSAGLISAKVVKVDAANDLALLKAEGKFPALPVATSRPVRLGSTVATVGFPNIGLQGFAPKFARGEIGSLSGPQDDARYFQISVPVQPGNSGGALVDEHGNVVGVVSATLSAKAALATSGALPQNVSYAVKSSFLLGFLESVPEVATKLKEPNAKDMKFDDVVEEAKEAAVLVLVY
jgi:TPR repeat protein